ncbi:MAG: ATP-binding protein [Bacillati bacterium ANGP1]|uniref:ATP-binding protein n=1 Tax=Candidatus Segetimicrobium genomatis TaxID=2569760 RepID=A0A537JBG4_9BACT|nr:MAG: ATP-binding protein [Terrabacteria group bacterium ANGP1]
MAGVSAGVPSFFWLLIWGVIIAAVVCLAATFLGQITITPFARRPRPDDPAPPGVRIDRLDLTVPADPRVLRSIRQSLRRLASDIGLDAERSEALVVAAGEAVSIHLRARRVGTVLVVEVQDHGRWRQGAAEEHRGHGLQLMRAFMDGVDIETTAVGTTVRLTLSLPRAV